MRVLIVSDEAFSTRERAMLARIEIGLADESVRVIHAMPERSLELLGGDLFSCPVGYGPRGLLATRAYRADEVLRTIARLSPPAAPSDPLVDVVHAFGEGCWWIASEVARQVGCTLVLEVWRSGLISRAARYRLPGRAPAPVLLAPDRAIERALSRESPGAVVRTARWGTHTPPQPTATLRAGEPIAIVLSGTGRDVAGFEAAIHALADVMGGRDDVMIFADAVAARRAGLWASARRLGLLDRFSLIPRVETERHLVLRAGLLVLPEALGEHRSLVLDAMACGLVVVARLDPMVSCLIDQRTALLVEEAVADRWRQRLEWVLEDLTRAAELAESAREYVRREHKASAHVAALLDAYEWITASATIPFEAPP